MIRNWLWLAAFAFLLVGNAPMGGAETSGAVCTSQSVDTATAGQPLPVWLSELRLPCGNCEGCNSSVCFGQLQGSQCNPAPNHCYSAKPVTYCEDSEGVLVVCCHCQAAP